MILSSYSLHKVNSDDTFSFDPSHYSRFKFGDEIIAKKFGIELAAGFIEKQLSLKQTNQQIVVISSPYSFIPTATFTMKNYFVFHLNHWLADNGLPVVQETKVHRTITYKEDYGELDAAERLRLIGNDNFHIDKEFLTNKILLFLDDIKITGSHERMIMKMIKDFDLRNEVHMIYFAELVNKQIHPNIENYLNYYQIKSIFDINTIIRSGNFSLNTRTVKYILISDFKAFQNFLLEQNLDFIYTLYNMALGNNYHTIEAYRRNLNFIKEHLFFNSNILQEYGN
ncbi:phosphoribosyltransferase family protein [Dyadobacter sp. 3J3]|uniref:phosphoribosyltransferase family protein n=1 Tax=Dyadobacter sp. 3J3 TaxID=2606600 RepID=UPI00135BEEFD|nr:phosphoribosyltransferase family protein [Dyadobacter sp. 3J3]